MTPLLISLVLTAALLHAVWNVMVKSSNQPEFSIGAYRLIGSLICIGLSALVPIPERESWLLLFISVIIHNLYYFCLARAYKSGDLSQVYPLFRGLAPVLVALGAVILAGEWLSAGNHSWHCCCQYRCNQSGIQDCDFGCNAP
jgi:multidrug transporter EmrE-like cation transporter